MLSTPLFAPYATTEAIQLLPGIAGCQIAVVGEAFANIRAIRPLKAASQSVIGEIGALGAKTVPARF